MKDSMILTDRIGLTGEVLRKCASILDTGEYNLVAGDGRLVNIFKYDNKSPFRRLQAVGLEGGEPVIFDRTQRGTVFTKFGIFVYRCWDSDVRFCWVATPIIHGYEERYIICRRGDLWKILRSKTRFDQQNVSNVKPILDPEVFSGILENTVEFLGRKREVESFNVKARRGVLLTGPPGNGKSMMCEYLWNYCTLHNIAKRIITSSDIEEAFSHNELGSLMSSSTVLFFDDIDISYMSRGVGGDSKMACSMLTAMQGINKNNHVIRIFTTNEDVSSLDEAFRRPGRIDKVYHLPKPTDTLRREFCNTWDARILDAIDVDVLVSSTLNMSFAQMDEVRTQLVLRYLVHDRWDLEYALAAGHNKEHAEGSFGFAQPNARKRILPRTYDPEYDDEE
jgi:hypothetical protein